MKIDAEVLKKLDELRAHGVAKAEFLGSDGELSSVEFFNPFIMAEAANAESMARVMAEGPREQLAQLERLEQDTEMPEIERQRLIKQYKRSLFGY